MAKKNAVRKYKEALKDAGKPFAQRKANVTGRDGSLKKARNYAMEDVEARKLRANFRKSGEFTNPYRKAGAYQAFISGLIALGVNERHKFSVVKQAMQKIMKQHKPKADGPNGWESFQAPKSGKPDVGKDVNGRIQQNAEVLQRLQGMHPYGWKLSQLHACIDILKGKGGAAEYMLNTNFTSQDAVKPTNEFRRQRAAAKPKAPKAAKKAAAPKGKKAAAKGKKTVKKAAKKAKAPAKKAKAPAKKKVAKKSKPKKATAPKAPKADPPAAPEAPAVPEATADEQATAAALAAEAAGDSNES